MNVKAKIYSPFYINNYLYNINKDNRRGIKLDDFPYRTDKFFNFFNRQISSYLIFRDKPDVLHETYYCNNGVNVPNNVLSLRG